MKLLIAEDEKDLAEALSVFFERNQFTVDTVHDGRDAYDYACAGDYDAIILDVMMPKMTGIEVVRRLREEGSKAPIMMLTAKAQKQDRIEGFDSGADDYLPKPFDTDELLARVRALLRRSGGDFRPDILTFSNTTLDTSSGILSAGGGSVRLSGFEFQILEMFMRSPGVSFSADRIMEHIWGWNNDAEVSVIWVHLSNLRKKLASVGAGFSIKSVRGIGYVLEENK